MDIPTPTTPPTPPERPTADDMRRELAHDLRYCHHYSKVRADVDEAFARLDLPPQTEESGEDTFAAVGAAGWPIAIRRARYAEHLLRSLLSAPTALRLDDAREYLDALDTARQR